MTLPVLEKKTNILKIYYHGIPICKVLLHTNFKIKMFLKNLKLQTHFFIKLPAIPFCELVPTIISNSPGSIISLPLPS